MTAATVDSVGSGAGSGDGPADGSPKLEIAGVRRYRQDIDLHPGPPGQSGERTWVLHDTARNRFFAIGWLEYEILHRWNLGNPIAIAQAVEAQTTLGCGFEDVQWVEDFLKRNELLAIDNKEGVDELLGTLARKRQSPILWLTHRYLFFRLPLFRPDGFLEATLPLVRMCFTRGFQWFMLCVALTALFLVSRQWDVFIRDFGYLFTLEGLASFAVGLIISKSLHELGHAWSSKYFGLRVPTMGVSFLVMWPFLYTDTSESWKLTRRRDRVIIGCAGMYAELCLAIFATLAWSLATDGGLRSAFFFIATASWIGTLAINANPFMKWDGYYILADAVGMQNMQPRAFALARWRMREMIFGFKDPAPEYLDPVVRSRLIVYAFTTWVYRFFLFIGIAVLVYSFLIKIVGIALMVIELAFFIVKPVVTEIREWIKRREDIRMNRNTVTSLLVVTAVVGGLFVPWKDSVLVPAVITPAVHESIYPALPARIEAVFVKQGDRVRKGDSLVSLRSADLEFQIVSAESQINLMKSRLALAGRAAEREERAILEGRLAEAVAAYKGFRDQIRKLEIKAPSSGIVSRLPRTTLPGQWVSETTLIARIVDDQDLEVRAYVKEQNLERVAGVTTADFVPDERSVEPVPVVVRDIDPNGVEIFEDRILASIHGGPVAVQPAQDGNTIVPVIPVYRMRLEPSEAIGVPHEMRGVLRADGEPRSIADRVWRRAVAVFVRESGF